MIREIQRLIANDPEDCRGLINTLITNGYIVWMAKVFDCETEEENTVIFYTLWQSKVDAETKEFPSIEVVTTKQLERIRQLWIEGKEKDEYKADNPDDEKE